MIFKKNRFKDAKLRTKLIISYLLLTVIPISIMGYFLYKQYKTSIEEQVGEYVPLLLAQASDNLDSQIETLKQLPDLIYNSNQVMEVLRNNSYKQTSTLYKDEFLVNNYLSRTYINGSNRGIVGVFILSKNRLYSSAKMPYEQFDFIHHPVPFGQELDLNGSVKIVLPNELSLKFENNLPYLLLMSELVDVDNRRNLGTIFLAVDLSFMETISNSLQTENKAETWVMDQEGQIIYSSDHSQIGKKNKELSRYPTLNGSFESKGKEMISVYVSDKTGWIIANKIKSKDLTKQSDLVRNTTIVLFIVLSLVSTILCVVVAWNVSHPLQLLTKLMKKVEKGNFDVDLNIDSKDEIGLLARSFNRMVGKIDELIKSNYHSQLKQKEAELYALQSQIHPHFMYNTLETIGMAVENEENDTAVKMVTLLGRMLRYSIGNKEPLVTLSQEVTHMRDYLTIQKIRFEDRIHFNIIEQMESHHYYAPKFILQPIVENSIKYGLDENWNVNITIIIKKETSVETGLEEIHLKVIDDGPGIPQEKLTEIMTAFYQEQMVNRDSSFGLINVHARIMMRFGQQYGIQIESTEGKGTEVMVKIPILHNEGMSE